MHIIISNSSSQPIYEQIKEQIRRMILQNELKAGDALPSMRTLALDLKVSVITTKRVYNDLEQEGYIDVIPGKGCFVAVLNKELIQEEILTKIEMGMQQIVELARRNQIPDETVQNILNIILEETEYGSA